MDGADVVLTSRSGKELRVPKAKLSQLDQRLADQLNATASNSVKSVNEVKARIASERFAKDVVTFLEGIFASKQVSPEIKTFVQDSLPEWQKLAADGAILYGGRWTRANEIAKIQREAAELMAQAVTMISIGNHVLARETLLKASKVDPEGIQADFTLGMLHSLVGGHPDEARTRFLVCLKRLEAIGKHRTALQNANLRAALNNIAITEVRVSKTSSAIARWTEAVEQGNVAPEIVQNIGRLSDLAAANYFVKIPSSTQKTVGLLYAKAATENSAREYDPSTGWLYIPCLCEAPTVHENEATPQKGLSSSNKKPSAGIQQLRVFASGSGFAVTDDLVVTNRHVAEGAHSFQLGDGNQSNRNRLSGELVAISKKHDLALIRFPGLKAPPLELCHELPRLAADVRVLGFPESKVLGDNLKVTAGSIAGLPQATSHNELHKMILLDAVANPGNSGGPVIDADGRVVGALTLGINLEQAYTAAVPAEDIRVFLAQHIENPQGPNHRLRDGNEGAAAKWEDIVEIAAKSTFQVLVLGGAQPVSWADEKESPQDAEKPKRPTGWNGLEDPWCMYCNGLSHIACPVRGCKLGVIVSRRQEITATPNGPISKWLPHQTPCKNCNGSGRVPCPDCRNGFDPRVKSTR